MDIQDEKIDFTYPDGFMKAANSLDFLPEEQRVMMTTMFVGAMLIL